MAIIRSLHVLLLRSDMMLRNCPTISLIKVSACSDDTTQFAKVLGYPNWHRNQCFVPIRLLLPEDREKYSKIFSEENTNTILLGDRAVDLLHEDADLWMEVFNYNWMKLANHLDEIKIWDTLQNLVGNTISNISFHEWIHLCDIKDLCFYIQNCKLDFWVYNFNYDEMIRIKDFLDNYT